MYWYAQKKLWVPHHIDIDSVSSGSNVCYQKTAKIYLKEVKYTNKHN